MEKRIEKVVEENAIEEGNYTDFVKAKNAGKYYKILQIAFEPDEFKKIWDKCPPLAKLSFLQTNMKYMFNEKKDEKEVGSEDIVKDLATKILGR